MLSKRERTQKLGVCVEETPYYQALWEFWQSIEKLAAGDRELGPTEGLALAPTEIFSNDDISISYYIALNKHSIYPVKLRFITYKGGPDVTFCEPIVVSKKLQPTLFVKLMVGTTHRLIYKYTKLYSDEKSN
ncbi:hypothetical protein MA9V2_026 [Chryseobacterium phage MA9V-2]|nr:hypothetical protein MA9V2_026 [Chryseobacterium phage MA9V-2]